MSALKNYLLTVLQACSEERTGQDAIEWAIVTGMVQLTYQLDPDVRTIADRYSEIIVAYQQHLAREAAVADFAHFPIPLAA